MMSKQRHNVGNIVNSNNETCFLLFHDDEKEHRTFIATDDNEV